MTVLLVVSALETALVAGHGVLVSLDTSFVGGIDSST